MTKDQRNKKLESLAKSGYGKALLEYLEEKINGLKDSTTIVAGTIEEKGRKLEARQEAISLLKDVFRFLEKKGETTEIKDKNQYL